MQPVGPAVGATEPASFHEPGLHLSHHVHDLLQSCKGSSILRLLQLLEDIALCQLSPLQACQKRVDLGKDPTPFSSQDEAAVSFGCLAARLPGQFLRFNPKLGIFGSTVLEGPENLSEQLPGRTSRTLFAKLWLYREVIQFVKTLRGLQTQSALTPYLFPKLWAFCEHPAVIQQLTTSDCGQPVYVLRREDHMAWAAISFLQGKLKRESVHSMSGLCV
ncbi:Protein SMG5 [Plecturocebus cupreus]